jgi:hypothetical protein
MRTPILCFVILLTGCATEPPCVIEDGRPYLLDTRELSGDCGDMGSALQTHDGAVEGCTTRRLAHATDVCAMSFERRCVAPDGSGQRAVILATYTRQDDDETWRGPADVTVLDAAGRQLCHSLYEATITPQ